MRGSTGPLDDPAVERAAEELSARATFAMAV